MANSKTVKILKPDGDVLKTDISCKTDKFYNLLLDGTIVRCVTKRSTAMSWYRDCVKRYEKKVKKEVPDTLFTVEEIKRRRIK